MSGPHIHPLDPHMFMQTVHEKLFFQHAYPAKFLYLVGLEASSIHLQLALHVRVVKALTGLPEPLWLADTISTAFS